jgi:alpha-galactosidase
MAEEREKNCRYQTGLALTYIAEEVCRQLPGVIVDLDVTEGDRYVGLGFLQAGKFFAINNGPYYHDFDIPDADTIYRHNWNVFFYPGPARNQICRQTIAYDRIIPSILFLVHFLPDGPAVMRQNALASLYLGGNGIWGDLPSLSKDDIREIAEGVTRYKKVARDVTEAYPRITGAIGASPEIYEKINPVTGRGLVSVFTRAPVTFTYITGPLDADTTVCGADDWIRLDNRRIKLTLSLGKDESRAIFFGI